jgi:hypothetical protein
MQTHRLMLIATLASAALLAACGGGSDADPDQPNARVPLGGAVLALAAEPYRNSMPIVFTPGQPMTCLNMVVPVHVHAVEGLLPAGLSLGSIGLRRGAEEVWRADATEQGYADGKLRGVARGCPTDKTAPGTAVRVVAELRHPGGTRLLYTDAVIGEAH